MKKHNESNSNNITLEQDSVSNSNSREEGQVQSKSQAEAQIPEGKGAYTPKPLEERPKKSNVLRKAVNSIMKKSSTPATGALKNFINAGKTITGKSSGSYRK